MPRKANKPPLSEWELRKEVIQSWMSQYPWNVVIEKMKEEHNFIASREQYDAQIRIWGTHKNLKKHEWRGALHRFDKLASRHQTKIRMRILDNIVSEDKMQRSRKRYCQSDPDVPDIVPLHVSFDILGADGAWSLCTSNEENIEKLQPSTSEHTAETGNLAVDLFSPDSLHNDATSINQQPENGVPASMNESSDLALQSSSESTYRGLDWVAMDIANDFDHQTTPNLRNPSINLSWTLLDCSLFYSPSSPFPFLYSNSLHGLCFKRFQNDLEKNGIDLANLGSKTAAKQNFGTSNFVTPFLRDVADVESSLSNTEISKRSVHHFQPRALLQSFQSLLPGEVCKEQSGNNTNLIEKDAMLDTNFMRLLVFSIVNGFAGLDQIPIGSILKFLSRHGNIGVLFAHVLEANPSCVAKSLAENLFKVAIEAQEDHIIKQLLGTRLLQINDIVCKAGGQKFTALERVAQLRDLKSMEVLLGAHADVNKTFAPRPQNGGPLTRLIDEIRLGETLSPNLMSLVQSLLQAGAEVHINILQHLIQYTRNSELAFYLLSEFLRTHDKDLISDGMLSFITLELEEEQACRSTELILQTCESLHKGNCFQEFMSQIEWALVQSAKRGHLRVAQLLLPHSRNLHAVLSASFRGGRRDFIDAVLARKPNFNAPAQSIDNGNGLADDIDSTQDMTTPLAEAIGTKVDDLIHLCEKAGALDHLHLSGHFEAALAAAATTGNSLYIQKLLHHRPKQQPGDMSIALLYSIQNGHDDIALELLKAGAQCNNRYSDLPSPLFAAIAQRNAHMVRAILDSSDLSTEMRLHPVAGQLHYLSELEEAVRWGDRSIILDLQFVFPVEKILTVTFLEETLGAGNEEFLLFLIDHNLVDNSALTRCLRGPIKHRNIAMVIRLVELGADPSNSEILSFAAQNQPDILRILLEHIPRPARQVVAGLGTDAINVVIQTGLAGLHTLEVLLSSKIVDFRSFSTNRSESPFGLAIRIAEEYRGSFPSVVRLLEAGCDPNSIVIAKGYRNLSNLTALLAAIETKNTNLVRLLLNHDAKVNTEATRGLTRTPLQRAAELGCLEIVQLLLEKGADVNALPAQRGGGTALQLAAISGNCNLAAEILERGADPNAPPSGLHGRWPIEGAAEHGRLDMIDFLFKVTVYDAEQWKRAMQLAQDNGYMGCRDLIQDQVNMNEPMDLLT